MRYSCSLAWFARFIVDLFGCCISLGFIPGPVSCSCESYFSASVVHECVCARTLMIWICERPWYSVYCSSYNFIHLYLTALLAIQAQIHSIMCACMLEVSYPPWWKMALPESYTILITKITSSNFSFVARIYLQKKKRKIECDIMNKVLAVRLQHVSVSMFIMFTHKVKQKLYCAPYSFVGSL